MVKIPKTKKCPRCGETHAISMFGLRRMHKDDKFKVPQSHCKKCRSLKPKSATKPAKKSKKVKKVDRE